MNEKTGSIMMCLQKIPMVGAARERMIWINGTEGSTEELNSKNILKSLFLKGSTNTKNYFA